MAFYSLPLERHNIDVPQEYCYLAIQKYTEDHFKPKEGKKKLSSQELKDKREKIERQQKTIKQLDAGYCNLHNNKIELETIFNSFFIRGLEDKDIVFYKIKPLASHKKTDGYYTRVTYETSEFDVIKKFSNKEEIIEQIYKDNLLREFSAMVFDSYSYGNEGYNLKIYEYFRYIKEKFNNFEISLSDIVLTSDYHHAIRNKFTKKDIYETSRENIRYLLDNDLIKYIKDEDYYMEKLIIGLIECGLQDIALNCVKLISNSVIGDSITKGLKGSKDFDIVLRKWSTDKNIKEIISFLGIKLSGVVLAVKDDNRILETKNFDNIGEVKTYLIKNYNVPFEDIMNKDVADIELYDEQGERYYTFEIS